MVKSYPQSIILIFFDDVLPEYGELPHILPLAVHMNEVVFIIFVHVSAVHTLPLCIQRHHGVRRGWYSENKVASAVTIEHLQWVHFFAATAFFERGIKSLVIAKIISSFWTRIWGQLSRESLKMKSALILLFAGDNHDNESIKRKISFYCNLILKLSKLN